MIKVIIGPVIFCTVIVGIASLGNLARAGGLALRALAYFLLMTVMALSLGLIAANVFQPGAGFEGVPSASDVAKATEQAGEGAGESGLIPFIQDSLLPKSFLGPFVDNSVLQVLVLAILTACAISALSPQPARPPRRRHRVHLEGHLRDHQADHVGGAGGRVRRHGVHRRAVRDGLARQPDLPDGRVLGHLRGVHRGRARRGVRVCGFNILKVIRLVKDELLIIVGTSSSESVLPRLLTKLESAGASKQTVGMVIPTGYSFNLDGTCIYLTLGALFIIQAGGESLPIGVQIGLAVLMVLTSKGAAGVTGAGLVTLAASLQAFGGEFFTPEAIVIGLALIVGIDRVMSEGRALTNMIGNVVATFVVARWNGELDRDRLQAVLDDPQLVEADMEAEHGSAAGEDEEDSAGDGGGTTADRQPAGAQS